MKFTFGWAPEGRTLTVIEAKTLKQAKTEFKKQFPAHAKYMGEVWIDQEKDPDVSSTEKAV